MRKLTCFLVLQVCFLVGLSCASAQVKNNVARLHAFVQETVAGNVQVDENGNQLESGVDVVHQLFVETTGKYVPQWNVVYTRKGVFAVQAEEIKGLRHQVGKLKSNGKASVITAKRGNRLWKLELIPMKARIPDNITTLLRKNEVVLVTEWKGKQYTHPVAKEIALETVFYK